MYHQPTAIGGPVSHIEPLDSIASLVSIAMFLGHGKMTEGRTFAARQVAEDGLLVGTSFAGTMHRVGAIHNLLLLK